MKKKLIKKEDLTDKLFGKEFFVEEMMILSPSAKDFLREKGIKIIYGEKDRCNANGFENRVERILKDSFGINDSAVTKAVIEKIEGWYKDGNK